MRITNFLTVVIHRGDARFLPRKTRSQFRQWPLELSITRIPGFNSCEENYYVDRKTGVLCAAIGYVSNLEELKRRRGIRETSDVKVILRLYLEGGYPTMRELDGVFTILLYDFKKGTGRIFRDRFGFNCYLYHLPLKEKDLFSTSLKALLPSLPRRKLDRSAAYQMLYHDKFTLSDRSLVEGIRKVPPQHLVEILEKAVYIRREPFPIKKKSRRRARKELLPSLRDNIKRLSQGMRGRRLPCALTGGFDSSIIYHFLLESSNKEIHAVTVGEKGKGEAALARKTLEHHMTPNHKVIPSAFTLEKLPEMVWELGDHMPSIMFPISHALAEGCSSLGVHSLFVGEGADSAMYQYRYSSLHRSRIYLALCLKYLKDLAFGRKKLAKIPDRGLSILGEQGPRIFWRGYSKARELSVKRSGILLNAHGIQAIYPFLNHETQDCCDSLGFLNFKKRVYKEEVRRTLGKKAAHLKKSVPYMRFPEITQRGNPILEGLLQTPLSVELLTKREIKKLREDPSGNYPFLQKLAFLFAFNELFLSGRYDSHFRESAGRYRFSKLLQKATPVS